MVYNVVAKKRNRHKGLYTNEQKKSTGNTTKFEKVVEISASVRTLDEICESLDYTMLYKAYKRKTAKGKADPVSLFKVLVYGYMTGRYSGRGIEEACKTNINFLWLLNEAEAPDHNTTDRFRKGRANEAVEDLFSQLVIKLKEMGEIH